MAELSALLGECDSPEHLLEAIRRLSEHGYRDLDAYTPYPLESVREALGFPRSRLPRAIFAGGLTAAAIAYGLQWLLVGHLYPLNVGGRPPHMPLAFFIITFEMGVLFAAFTGFIGVLARARLLRLWDPVFEVEGFESATLDRYWVRLNARDPRFDSETTPQHLIESGALRVVREEATLR